VATFEELDQLSSKELHDRAVQRAERHLDVKFFWRLLEMVPAAEAAKGDAREAEWDAQAAHAQFADAITESDDPHLLDSLRPVFIEYLMQHDDG
jgi:hypothetical protein